VSGPRPAGHRRTSRWLRRGGTIIAYARGVSRTWASSAFGLLLAGCSAIPTSTEANVSYSTETSAWSSDVECLNPATRQGPAKEVLDGRRRTVVIAGGPRPISDAAWADYDPSLGHVKNSDRHLLFTRSCFSRSPGAPADCTGDECRAIVEIDGYTWVDLSKVEAADCLPSPRDCDGTTAKPGGLVVVVTRKCHELVFEGEAYFLRGPRGERAVMHATADGHPTTDVALPPGWSLTKEPLDAPLVVHPFGGGSECFYNVIRDHEQQAYHQIDYPGDRYP